VNELRTSVVASLDRLNRDHGGRYLGRVAAALGVHRSSVSRWLAGEAAPSYERCMELANRYPGYFDRAELVELLTRDALGGEPVGASALAAIRPTAPTFAALATALTEAIEREPPLAADREILHVSLEAEAERVPRPGESILETEEDRTARRRYQAAMDRRAREGWRMRTVSNAFGPERFDALDRMANALEGPDVEIRAYAMTVPSVMSQFVIGRRHVFIGYNGGLQSRPTPSMLHIESPDAVAWATRYFDALFNEAPFRLRTPKGVSATEFARLSDAVGASR
jgi:transcriptional regulator with XRE-family HTH domain